MLSFSCCSDARAQTIATPNGRQKGPLVVGTQVIVFLQRKKNLHSIKGIKTNVPPGHVSQGNKFLEDSVIHEQLE